MILHAKIHTFGVKGHSQVKYNCTWKLMHEEIIDRKSWYQNAPRLSILNTLILYWTHYALKGQLDIATYCYKFRIFNSLTREHEGSNFLSSGCLFIYMQSLAKRWQNCNPLSLFLQPQLYRVLTITKNCELHVLWLIY